MFGIASESLPQMAQMDPDRRVCLGIGLGPSVAIRGSRLETGARWPVSGGLSRGFERPRHGLGDGAGAGMVGAEQGHAAAVRECELFLGLAVASAALQKVTVLVAE